MKDAQIDGYLELIVAGTWHGGLGVDPDGWLLDASRLWQARRRASGPAKDDW